MTLTPPLLRRAGAPLELIAWLGRWTDPEHDWDGCDRPDWLVWLAGCAGVPLAPVVDAAKTAVLSALTVAGADEATLGRIAALDLAPPKDDADRAEPDGPPDLLAAGWLAQAYDAVAAAEAIDEGRRLQRGLHLGGIVGVPPVVTTPRRDGPLPFDPASDDGDPVWQELAFAVAAAAHAVDAATTALMNATGSSREDAESTLADVVHRELNALWRARPEP